MGNIVSQSVFIPAPTFTLDQVEDQSDRVHIVTGGYSGVGLELVKLLLQKKATVYIGGRTREKYDEAVTNIDKELPNHGGRVEFLYLDLADLPSCVKAAEEFMERENRLDVLTNNAGVLNMSKECRTKQGHESQMGTNCVGPYLFTKSLIPILKKTAQTAPKDTVRVTWAASIAVDLMSPKGGVVFDEATGAPVVFPDQKRNYAQSKSGNVLLAWEFGKLLASDGIVNVSWNPGNLKSNLVRQSNFIEKLIVRLVTHPAYLGGFTELFAGWSPSITSAMNGAYVIPWGRLGTINVDLAKSFKDGTSEKFFAWCEEETKSFIPN